MASKRPDSDVWNIVDNDEMSQHYGRNFKFDFSYISSDEIKELFKDYVWQNYTYNGFLVARLGGRWGDGSGCGFSLSGNYASGDRDRTVGGRLLYVPQTKVA